MLYPYRFNINGLVSDLWIQKESVLTLMNFVQALNRNHGKDKFSMERIENVEEVIADVIQGKEKDK